MNVGSTRLFFHLSIGILSCLLAAPLEAAVVVDDDFSDGDFAKTGALDTNWWTSSSSSGKEISVGSLGLVTGTSGRGIHTVFPTQTLNVGEMIRATYTFTTPATIDVSGGNSAAFRVGIFDTLGRAGLDADVDASSSSPNELYGWGAATGGPSNQPLPGYMLDMDVYAAGNAAATEADLNFREHNQDILFGTGRLMATTTGWSSISPSGPDEGYTWAPNTTYTGSFTVARTGATTVSLVGTLDGATFKNTDEFDSVSFGMFGFHVNSNKFGSSNVQNEPDNGLDFSRITIEVLTIPEPSSLVLALGAMTLLTGIRRQ